MKPKSLWQIFFEEKVIVGETVKPNLWVRQKDWKDQHFVVCSTIKMPDNSVIAIGWTVNKLMYDAPFMAVLTNEESWYKI